jgi:multidrug efflux pump subunit AcrA (membrane-fusion protein)
MNKKPLLLILVSGLVLQLACSEKQASTQAPARKPVSVSVIVPQYQSVPAIVEAPGTVQPRNRIALASQINGFVRDMRVRAGDTVKPEQVLAILDARDAESQKVAAQAAVEEAEAALLEARRAHQAALDMQAAAKASTDLAGQTLGRYQKLFESRSVSPQEIDEVRTRRDASAAELASRAAMVAAARERIKQAEARISQAKAQAGRAEVLMSWTQVKAPAAGRIVERAVDTGGAVFPGSPLVVIESTARPQVLADLPTEFAGQLHVGISVRMHSDSSDFVDGRVSEIVPLSNPGTHTIQFKVDLPPDYPTINGQFLKVQVPVGRRNALLVARRAIRETGQLSGLFVLEDSARARFRLVKISRYDAENFEVLSGLESGEKVIANPGDQITDGTPVEIR